MKNSLNTGLVIFVFRVIKLFYYILKNKKIKNTLDINLIFLKVIKLFYCYKKTDLSLSI